MFITFLIGAHMANNVFQLGGIVVIATSLAADPLTLLFTGYVVGLNLLWAGQRVLAVFVE